MQTLFYFILAIGILVAFHEFGHFWVARKLGVKVLRFSVGFGKVIWSHQKSPETTEYALSAIPLGGYVKMVDEREGPVERKDLPYAFNRQPLWARFAIVLAGPVFNLILAIILYWCVFTIGETGMRPIIGQLEPNTLAIQAGFQEGEEILSVNDSKTPTWSEAITAIVTSAIDADEEIKIQVTSENGEENTRVLRIPENVSQDPKILYERLGLTPWSPKIEPVIGKVIPEGSAAEAGLQTGDILISADKVQLTEWMQWVDYVRDHADKAIDLEIERDGVRLQKIITPKAVETEDGIVGKIGTAVLIPPGLRESMIVEYSLPPVAALSAATKKTYEFSAATLKMMGRMLIGKASVDNLSGPISIAQYAGQSAEMGLTSFLKFLALVSVSLGVINLLPVPVLDGGHLMFYIIEAIKGSPVPEKIQIFFQQVGIVLLMLLMGLAVMLDIERLFQ
jgi:regulator of sigma E protease